MRHIVAALKGAIESDEKVGAEAESMLGAFERQSAETVLTSLINDLATIRTKVVLVLEDYHLVDSNQVDDIVSFFIDHMPASLHLIVTTRSDPALPVARLRVRGDLTEIRASDLRFSISEATAFLNEVMELDLSPESVAALERRTEGWIAGLQLAALSLKNSDDVERFVTLFTGSHQHVMDYLVEEVVSSQPEAVQRFLLQTSILDRLTGPLCDALTGRDDSQSMLETLERSNLFVVSLDQERRWYRYHHLFADLLRQRLTQTERQVERFDGGNVRALHARASSWFEENGYIDQAIEHALSGDLTERAATLIESLAETEWASGDSRFLRWIGRLGTDVLAHRPFLCILNSYRLCFKGEAPKAVEESLERAKHAVAAASERKAVMRGRLAPKQPGRVKQSAHPTTSWSPT
jgi:LuxR family maltose regulon positive regulatory protein